MKRRKQGLPDDPSELEAEAQAWFQLQEEFLEEIIRVAVQYHAELGRDDPAHRGRLSKLKSRLRDWVHNYSEAREELGKVRQKQLRIGAGP